MTRAWLLRETGDTPAKARAEAEAAERAAAASTHPSPTV
jgi:hypothetical protein